MLGQLAKGTCVGKCRFSHEATEGCFFNDEEEEGE